MTVGQGIFLAIAQLAPSHLFLAHSGVLSDRAENSNAYVRAIRRITGALDSSRATRNEH